MLLRLVRSVPASAKRGPARALAPRTTPGLREVTPRRAAPAPSPSPSPLLSPLAAPLAASSALPWSAPPRRTFVLSAGPRARRQDDDPFAALHARPWYAMGTGAWIGLAVLAGVGIALIYFFWQHRQDRARRHAVKVAGRTRIGGNWSLVDQNGVPLSAASLHGRYILLYFGFTFCPDVCPIELQKLGTIVDALDAELADKEPGFVQPLFVSLDPWRDSVEQIGAYTAQFHPRLLGATGTPQQCDTMARMFRVYTSSDRSSSTVDPSVDDYTVDHSIFIYFLDTEGKFIDFFGVNKERDEIVDSILRHMEERGHYRAPLLTRLKRLLTFDDD